jgi:SAM-dependent methyltransferase
MLPPPISPRARVHRFIAMYCTHLFLFLIDAGFEHKSVSLLCAAVCIYLGVLGFTFGRLAQRIHGMPQTAQTSNVTHGVWHDCNGLLACRTLPFDSDSFDAVTIALSVQYLVYPEQVVEEIGRVLRPGGTCIISFSNRMFPSKVCLALARTNPNYSTRTQGPRPRAFRTQGSQACPYLCKCAACMTRITHKPPAVSPSRSGRKKPPSLPPSLPPSPPPPAPASACV